MNSPALSVDVDGALLDAVDLHVHPGPSPFPRRFSLAEAAAEAAAAGFATIAVKSHHHSMVPDVLAVSAALGKLPLEVLSGVALNNQVGGINASAVELTLGLGGRFVWLPTIAAANHLAASRVLHTFPRSDRPLRPSTPVEVLDGDGTVTPEVRDVLTLIGEFDAVLACGHLAVHEIDAVIDAALDIGVRRIVVNHPNFVVGASPAHCRAWAQKGVAIEHSLCHYDEDSTMRKWDLPVLLSYVEAAGPEHTLLSSDLGQAGNPTPTQAFRAIVPRLAAAGMPWSTIRQLVSTTARTLID